MSKTLNTENELNNFIKTNDMCVVLFGEDDCINCSILENIIESLRPKYPLVSFGFAKGNDLSRIHHIKYFPTLSFFENGMEIGSMIGTAYMMKIRNILDLWFLKE